MMDLIKLYHPSISEFSDKNGVITLEHVKKIASEPNTRLSLILVRCGCGRFLAPAQDIAHFTDIVSKSDVDYVRDISIPVYT